MARILWFRWTLFMPLAILCCGEKADPVGGVAPHDLPDVVTYTQHVKPLLDRHCIQCHATYRQGADRSGAPVGIDYDTYAASRATVEGGRRTIPSSMPPGGGLTQYDRSLFDAWVQQGMPE